MKRKLRFVQIFGFAILVLVVLALTRTPSAIAQQSKPAQAAAAHDHNAITGPESGLPPLMERAEEIALAESAGPTSFAKEAAIFVLERGKGYTLARAGKNGFTCIVNRDRPDTLEPECYDPEGTASILPVSMEKARLREQGRSGAEIERKINEGFASGTYHAPRRPGITYMLYKANRVFAGTEVITYPAHVMVFAPYLKNTDIGADMRNAWMPWVLNEGSPHAYIIIRTGESRPQSSQK